MNASAALAKFGIETQATALPDEVVTAARRTILDTIGVSIAGVEEQAARIVTQQAINQTNSDECLIWGTDSRASAQLAALANGTASHVLDFDDTNDSLRGHPSVAILPAVYAMGERVNASGMEVLTAFVIGVEAACKLGLFTGQKPYDHGWHVTATHGVVGATVGAGRLAGLTVEQLQHAIGIAVSSASGVRGNFGSMTKSLHIGRLAQSAIMAVELAQQGFTASTAAIDGDFGYWTVFGRGSSHADESIGDWLGNPYELVSPGFNVKAYPCCAATHASIDAAREVHEKISADDIERIHATVPYIAPLLLIHHRPTEPLAAKFSLEYTVATALLDGMVTLDHFTEASVRRPDIQELLRQVTYEVPPEWDYVEGEGTFRIGVARIDVYQSDGTVHHAETTEVRGSPGRPLTDEELAAKFVACAGRVFDEGTVQEILEALRHVEDLDSIRQLSDRLIAQAVVPQSV